MICTLLFAICIVLFVAKPVDINPSVLSEEPTSPPTFILPITTGTTVLPIKSPRLNPARPPTPLLALMLAKAVSVESANTNVLTLKF